MKIKVSCQSILLDKALKSFLKKYISYDDYDIYISDVYKDDDKLFLINQDIKKPFSKQELLKKLKKFGTHSLSIDNEVQKLLKEYTTKIGDLYKQKHNA